MTRNKLYLFTTLSLALGTGCKKASKDAPASGSGAPQPAGSAAGSATEPAAGSATGSAAAGSASAGSGSGTGSANATSEPISRPAGPYALKLRVETKGSDGDDVPHFVPETGSFFPAVSGDGSKLAVLFEDEMDLSSIPISTLWVIDRTGKRTSVTLGGADLRADGDAALADDKRKAAQAKRAKVVADATAAADKAIAGDKWTAADVLTRKTLADLPPDWQKAMTPAYADTPDADVQGSFLVAGDMVIAFRPKTSTLELLTLDKGAIHATPIRQKFAAPGSNGEGPAGTKPKPCGEITGLSSGFASASFGKAVLLPSVQLGGDACVGNGQADDAIVIDLPRPAAKK